MSKVYTGASVSLDGYIAGPGESGFEHLFAWYGNGDVPWPTANPEMTFSVTQTSWDHLAEIDGLTGSLVVGRKLFDFTSGWGGKHPLDKPVVVLTHKAPEGWEDTPFTFVTEGIERAIEVARELAGDKNVGVNGGTIASQCLDAGLLDEVWFDLVPVLLGAGTPFFSSLASIPAALDGPYNVQEGNRVTHLRYRVVR
jgi:dihydrofolate reductase